MARGKKPFVPVVDEEVKPASPESRPGDRPLVGRAKIKLSPVKEWSGGMSAEEATVWEAIAEKVRSGTPPRIAAGACGLGTAWDNFKRQKHPVVGMMLAAWDEGTTRKLDKIQESESWQAHAWTLERTRPMEFAVDNAIRQTIFTWAQEAGLEVADLADLIRIVKEAKELEISLWDVLEEAKSRAKAVQGL